MSNKLGKAKETSLPSTFGPIIRNSYGVEEIQFW